jgi:hypothetical protein
MRELFNIFKDIKSGALPLREVPGFTFWAVRKSRRTFWLVMVVAAAVIYLREKAGR